MFSLEMPGDQRNTPTCVGKTNLFRTLISGVMKHPHVRGEDKKTTPLQNRNVETPPRAWGRHQHLVKEPR